jgi:hypothetical protein
MPMGRTEAQDSRRNAMGREGGEAASWCSTVDQYAPRPPSTAFTVFQRIVRSSATDQFST